MTKIEIFEGDSKILTRSFTGKNGQPMVFNEQTAYLHNGGRFPVQVKISLENGQPAYAVGLYVFHESSFEVNDFGGIALKRRPLLVPVPVEKGVK